MMLAEVGSVLFKGEVFEAEIVDDSASTAIVQSALVVPSIVLGYKTRRRIEVVNDIDIEGKLTRSKYYGDPVKLSRVVFEGARLEGLDILLGPPGRRFALCFKYESKIEEEFVYERP